MKKICLFILLYSPAAFAQFYGPSEIWGTSHLQKADMLYEQNFYEEAIVYYKKELENFDLKEDVYAKLARCYSKLADYKNVNSNYRILAQTNALNEPEDKFNFAESLLSMGLYEESIVWFNNYLETTPGDQLAITRLQGLEDITRFMKDSTYKVVKPFDHNTEHTEFGAVPYGDGILFTSAREKDLIIQHDHLRKTESLLDMYYLPDEFDSTTQKIGRIKISSHWKSNDGPAAIGNSLIVVNRNNGKQKEDVYNSLGLQFYVSNELSMQHLYNFPHNDNSYSIMHPALTVDEDTLYFASDMPGGFGGMDIFYSVFVGESWSSPVNVGDAVNTSADEIFPFTDSGKLYFSSDGHEGLGGLDIYVWNRYEEETNSVVNLGYPINSGWDDFSIFLRNNKGYMASNRPGGLGNDDIYEIELLEIPEEVIAETILKLDVTDYLNSEGIETASINLLDKTLNTELTFFTNEEGALDETIPSASYTLTVSKSGFEIFETEMDLIDVPMRVEEIFLKPDFNFEDISLDSILFELNDFRLSGGAQSELDDIIDIMKKYEEVNLEVAAHTDSRGEASYNSWLSEMRAASTANYLIDKGIPFERINISGYGEEQLLNHCKDGVDCSEEQHSINRRIEFRFLFDKDKE
jgi:outer membrane protein OmpA-like peptidoglycan-associated protein/tetratricopeptide (TPR) repeat protein